MGKVTNMHSVGNWLLVVDDRFMQQQEFNCRRTRNDVVGDCASQSCVLVLLPNIETTRWPGGRLDWSDGLINSLAVAIVLPHN